MSVYLAAKDREIKALRGRIESKDRQIDRLRGLLKGVLGAWLEDAAPDELQWLVDNAKAALAGAADQPQSAEVPNERR